MTHFPWSTVTTAVECFRDWTPHADRATPDRAARMPEGYPVVTGTLSAGTTMNAFLLMHPRVQVSDAVSAVEIFASVLGVLILGGPAPSVYVRPAMRHQLNLLCCILDHEHRPGTDTARRSVAKPS